MILATEYLLRSLADIIAPARCLRCLREGTWLCQACEQDLPTLRQRCIVCNHIQPRGAACVRHRAATPLSGVISAGSYGAPHIKRGVHWLKFRGVRAVAPFLAHWLAPLLPMVAPLPALQRQAAIVPIALHRRRLRARGFNQSLEIAAALSAQTGIRVADILARRRATWSQAELPHDMRERNVAQAFEASTRLPRAKYILLLDDVTTTGATLASAASVLKGATQEIWGITVARG